MSYIREFPHASLLIHYHPTRRRFSLDDVRFALGEGLHALEVDLHLCGRDGRVLCNHGRPCAQSPALDQVIDLILTWKGNRATVHGDGRQFFLVLDPKDGSVRLFSEILTILDRYARHWSTAVSERDPPRGITVVVSGKYGHQLHAHFQADKVNRLCIVESHHYGPEIRNLAEGQPPFQWVALKSGDERGRVNSLHAGTDARVQGQNNVRVWDCNPDDLLVCLASGADQINCDHGQVTTLKRMMRNQPSCGQNPALAVRDEAALLTWQGASSNDLYVALGTADEAGLSFSRQIALTRFLADEPMVLAPDGALTPDGQLLVLYEAVSDQNGAMRLWHRAIQSLPDRLARLLRRPQGLRYISGRFTSLERFLTFDGGAHCLTSLSGTNLYGRDPALAVGPDGRVLIVYEDSAGRGLFYFSGRLKSDGLLEGQTHSLIEGQVCLGRTPAIAVDNAYRVVVVFHEPRKRHLECVSGFIDQSGRIVGRRFPLARGRTRAGGAPSVTMDLCGRVIVAYKDNRAGGLSFASGSLDETGCFDAEAFSINDDRVRHGKHPTIASDRTGAISVLFETPADQSFRYVRGAIRSGRLAGEARLLTIDTQRR